MKRIIVIVGLLFSGVDAALLHDAAKEGNLEDVNTLITGGADANVLDQYENTPLNFAARRGDIDIANALITAGANVNAQNKFGVTPMGFAALKNRAAFVTLLLTNGANINALDSNNNSPLHNAGTWNRVDVAKVLITNANLTLDGGNMPTSSSNVISSLITWRGNVDALGASEKSTVLTAAAALNANPGGLGAGAQTLLDEYFTIIA